jgi:hypothetical protein
VSQGATGCGRLEHALGEYLAVLLSHQRAERVGMGIEPVGHLVQGLVAQATVPGPWRGVERAAGGRDGRAGLGFAAVGPSAQHHSGGGVDRLRDGAGTDPFTVDPVVGDLAHVGLL